MNSLYIHFVLEEIYWKLASISSLIHVQVHVHCIIKIKFTAGKMNNVNRSRHINDSQTKYSRKSINYATVLCIQYQIAVTRFCCIENIICTSLLFLWNKLCKNVLQITMQVPDFAFLWVSDFTNKTCDMIEKFWHQMFMQGGKPIENQ